MSFENTFDQRALTFVGGVEMPQDTKVAMITGTCSLYSCQC